MKYEKRLSERSKALKAQTPKVKKGIDQMVNRIFVSHMLEYTKKINKSSMSVSKYGFYNSLLIQQNEKKAEIAFKLSQKHPWTFSTVFAVYLKTRSIVQTNNILLYCSATTANPFNIINGYVRKIK